MRNLYKEVLRRKSSPAKYQREQKPLQTSWVEEVTRESLTMNRLEDIRALQSAKRNRTIKNCGEEAKENAIEGRLRRERTITKCKVKLHGQRL